VNGIRLRISHPDFRNERNRQLFVDGFRSSWHDVNMSGGVGTRQDAPLVRPDGDTDTVEVFFSYGREGQDVRYAEGSVAIAIASISYGVASHNRSGGHVMPAYEFAVERNVEIPIEPAETSAPMEVN
jgi:hypothetical protein